MRTNNINSVTVLFVAPNFKEEAHLYVEKSSQERQEAVFFFLFFKNSIVLLTEECSIKMYRKQTAQETGLTQMPQQDVANSYFPYSCDYILLPQSPWESILDPPNPKHV